jgi:mRNA-degrading endonuclease RelE of RelBE toxin-antitoxin system
VDFLISDTFTDSLARLTGDEQKAVKTTAFDLQLDPASPGMSFHKLDRAKDKNFWSVRVSRDIRLIVHKTSSRLLLCFVGHHDRAYEWAERRKLETHPTTGAAQLVEVVETVQEVVVPVYVQEETPAPPKPALFAGRSEEELLGYGVPAEWVDEVRRADEDSLFVLSDHLPAEAAEALLELATGGSPRMAAAAGADPFEHPDAQRRFRLMTGTEELELALDYPWEKWTIFLHPEQRQRVERDYAGPARVSGSAGTGKTIVALHRAAFLAREEPEARVLLATFSEPLANALRTRLRRLIGSEPRLGERIDVEALDTMGVRLYRSRFGEPKIADHEVIRDLLDRAASEIAGHTFSQQFLLAEWEYVVDGWQLDSWESYRDVARLGRKTRLAERQREVLWAIFEKVREELRERGLVTRASIFSALTGSIVDGARAPFDFAVVDEAQDLSVSQLRFLAAVGGD